MAQYTALFFKISTAKDRTCPSDNPFRATQDQSDIPGNLSGNKGDGNIYGSTRIHQYNTILWPSGADSGVRNQGLHPGVGDTGIIISIPERHLAKN